MADEKETKTPAEEVAEQVSLKITKEVADKVEEAVAKLNEKYEEKAKAFKFHGSAVSKAETSEAKKQLNAVEFIKAVATNDDAKAMELSNIRANAIGEKTINITTGASGGYLVPDVFETQIHSAFDSYDEIIRNADVKTYNKPGYVFKLNELDTKVSVFWSDEDSTGITASTPTFSEPSIAVADIIGSTDLTLDFLEDTETDIMSNLAQQFGEQMAKAVQGRLINADVTISGVVTKGIFNVAGANVVETGITTGGYVSVTAGDIENLWFDSIAVDGFQASNKNGQFYMHPLVMQKLRANIRTATSDRDYLTVFDSAEMTLMGRPIILTNQAPIPTTTTSNPFVVYCDLAQHLKVRRKRGITMKVNDTGTTKGGRNLNYQLGRELVVSQRIGHQVVLAEGIGHLVT